MPFKELPEGQTQCFDENKIKQKVWRITFKTPWSSEFTVEVAEKEPISKDEAMAIARTDLVRLVKGWKKKDDTSKNF